MTTYEARQNIHRILHGADNRLLVVIGPCSIHDVDSAVEYAIRLQKELPRFENDLLIVMRVYFEKPRTTVGWKGLINDPRLDNSFRINEGLRLARGLLLQINDLGLPCATEFLDTITPQYTADLIAWGAIGARTTESQVHRELASGLSCPVGFKNGTDGGLTVATNALNSVAKPHRFLGINSEGQVSLFTTRGNPYGHIVLRGGSNGPNYDSVHIRICEQELEKAGVAPNIMVDCSHANSNKQPELQPLVVENVANQILEGNKSIVGLMIESNIHAGNQSIPENLEDLAYGVSVTDGCIDWETTEAALRTMRASLRDVLPRR
jgi:3-deoxy-7-phosphoheptulonate synthase